MIINGSVSSAGALAVALAGGAFTVSGFDATASTNAGTLDIVLLDSTTLTAPAAVYFGVANQTGFSVSTADVDGIYEPLLHEITYIWTVRGSPLTLESPGNLNMPTVWKNPNLAYGPEASFVFNDAGTYDIDLWAVDETGVTGVDTYQVVVAAANTTYATTDTIVYSEGSTWTGEPSGATRVTTLAGLNSAIDAKGAAYLRVLFNGGEAVTFTSQIDARNTLGIAVGSYGTGRATLPLMKNKESWDSHLVRPKSPGGDLKYYNINISGEYDAERERGHPGQSPFWRDAICDLMFHRVNFTGATLIGTTAAAGSCLVMFSEVDVTNWQDMGIYLQAATLTGTKYYAVINSAVHQNANAAQGAFANGLGDKVLSNVHGPMRAEQPDHLNLRCIDFFSRNGWSGGLGGSADQPCFRHNSNGVQGQYLTMDRCAMEGGYQVIKARGQDASTQDVPGNWVVDKLLTVGSPETQFHIECHFGGTTIRNWLAVETNVPKNSYGLLAGMGSFGIDTAEVLAVNQDSEVAVYNSTLISLLSTANNRAESSEPTNENVEGVVNGYTISGDVDDPFNNFTNDNNVEHFPNQNTAVTTFAPVDLTTNIAGFTARFKGVKNSLVTYQNNSPGLPGDVTSPTGTLVLAYADFPDKDGATQDKAYWDAREAAGDTLHGMHIGGVGRMFSYEGEFTVDFNASDITFTNTSGVTWGSGAYVQIKLDQSGNQAAIDTAYDVTGQTIPTGRPTTGSSAIGAGDTGRKAYDDFELTVRPASGADKGAVEAGDPVVGTATGNIVNSVNGQTVTLPVTLLENDVVVIAETMDAFNGSTYPTEGGYSEIAYEGANPMLRIIAKRMGATPDTTLTFNGIGIADSSYDYNVYVMVLRGIDATTMLDVAVPAVSSSSGTTVTPTPITTSSADTLILLACGHDDDATDTVSSYPSGYDNTDSYGEGATTETGSKIAVATKVLSSAGTETPGDFVWSAADGNECFTIAFRLA